MRRMLVALAVVFMLSAGGLGARTARATSRDNPVDLANKPIQLQSSRVDPLNGQSTNLPVPLNTLPPQIRDLFTTPVGVGLNTFWSKTAVPFLCQLAKDTLNGQGGSGFNLYGTECGFAPAGRATATAVDGGVQVTFFLPRSFLKVNVTTPGTCAAGHGTIFCPTDPRLSLTADFTLTATIKTPGSVCDAHIDPFTVHASNVVLDSQDVTADIAKDGVTLIADLTGVDYITLMENFIESGVDQMNNNAVQMQQAITSQVAAFTSRECNLIIPSLPSANDLWLLNSSVDPNQGIIFQLVDEPPLPSLFSPTLTASVPTVTAGSTVQLSGSFFPPNGGTATLTLGDVRLGTATISAQGTFSKTVTIPATTAPGNDTILATAGTAQAQTAIQVLAAGAPATLVVSWQGQQFTIVDTDYPFTLSGTGLAPGSATVYLDSATGLQIGTVTVGGDGTFSQNFQINSDQLGNHLGQHAIVAVQNGNVVASVTVTVELPEVIH